MALSKATQTEDDWDEVKADVKQLVNALRSLNPQSKEVESKREFGFVFERAPRLQRYLRPTDHRLESLALPLVSVFTTFESENQIFQFLGREISVAPTFSIRIPRNLIFKEADPHESWEMSPGNDFSETQVSEIRNYFIKHRARASAPEQDRVGINTNSNEWEWNPPYHAGGSCAFYNVHSNNTQTESRVLRTHKEILDFNLQSGYGHGIICLIKAPVKDGVLNISWVNLIMAHISRWNYSDDSPAPMDILHFSCVLYFLGVFAGFWPSRKERLRFARQHSLFNFDTFDRWYLQVHFRYFAGAAEVIKNEDAYGLQCNREKGNVAHYSFEEKRISVLGLLSADNFTSNRTTPALYTVLVLGEANFSELDSYILKWRPGLQGTIAFQFAVLASVDVWETEWNKVLDQIEACLNFQLDQTSNPTEINLWMFDDNFERSRLYFTILQTLRIFGERITTTSDDLRPLDDLFLRRLNFPMQNMRQYELQALRSNWELVRETQRTAQKNLSDRVLNKTEELKSLRDGLFNASSLREANRSSLMGRYVLIFTVVTVLYLPPSFVSTVFALDIFQKDAAQTKWHYKVALVSVSLFTYTIALAFIIAVDWNNFRRRCSSWWVWFSPWRGNSSSVGSTAGSLDDSAADVPTSRVPEQEVSSPNEATPARKVGDEESGPHEPKHRFPRFPRTGKSGESSDPMDKGKAPEKSPGTTRPVSNK